jgi:hypothetical protein
MLEMSGSLGWLSAALLFASGAAWLKLGRGPRLRWLNGRGAVKPDQLEGASRLLMVALGASVVAAAAAIAGWMFA